MKERGPARSYLRPARRLGVSASTLLPVRCFLISGLVLSTACGNDSPYQPGSPLPGLSPAELARFREGAALFHQPFTPEQGLGPLFNQDRCSSCHDLPVLGGTGVETARKATRWIPPSTCDLLEAQGGDNFQLRATAALAAAGIERETRPPAATAEVMLSPPALFGLGRMDAISVEAILAGEDPEDRDGDGVSGRAGRTPDGRVGRFGQKADVATLAEFVDIAIRTEMGLTTPDHPAEESVNGQPLPHGTDPAGDPEVDSRTLTLLVDFVRLLAVPPPLRPSTASGRDSVREGERVFGELGCTGCHVPALRGARGEPVRLYSDLLLHDLGPGLADICGAGASPSEWRTARLAGLRFRVALLHDGRAQRLEDAIMMHGGEATTARDAFARLRPSQRAALLAFLASL